MGYDKFVLGLVSDWVGHVLQRIRLKGQVLLWVVRG